MCKSVIPECADSIATNGSIDAVLKVSMKV